MQTGIELDKNSRFTEFRLSEHQPKNPVIRFFANLISYLFHPLFIPVYLIAFVIAMHPYLFASFSYKDKVITIVRFFVMYSFFPMVTVGLCKGLGFLDSVFLRTQRDRVIPYIACGIYYFWMSYVLRNQPVYPKEIVELAMAIFIASVIGLLLNIAMKVSMHTIAAGIMLAFMTMMAFTQSINYTLYFSIALLITGLISTSRLIVSNHTNAEIYWGLLAGIASMGIGIWANGALA